MSPWEMIAPLGLGKKRAADRPGAMVVSSILRILGADRDGYSFSPMDTWGGSGAWELGSDSETRALVFYLCVCLHLSRAPKRPKVC